MKTQSELTGITKSNPVTMENLTKQVLEATPEEESDGDSELAVVSFVMAQQHTGEVDASGKSVNRIILGRPLKTPDLVRDFLCDDSSLEVRAGKTFPYDPSL